MLVVPLIILGHLSERFCRAWPQVIPEGREARLTGSRRASVLDFLSVLVALVLDAGRAVGPLLQLRGAVASARHGERLGQGRAGGGRSARSAPRGRAAAKLRPQGGLVPGVADYHWWQFAFRVMFPGAPAQSRRPNTGVVKCSAHR